MLRFLSKLVEETMFPFNGTGEPSSENGIGELKPENAYVAHKRAHSLLSVGSYSLRAHFRDPANSDSDLDAADTAPDRSFFGASPFYPAAGAGTGLTAASPNVVTHQGSGFVFNNTFGSGATTAFENDVVAAESYLQSQFGNACTVNCTFDVQQLDPSFSGQNNFSPIHVTYSAFVSALTQHATTTTAEAAAAALANLSDPSNGAGFDVSVGEAQILGLASADSGTDDTIVLNSDYWTASTLQSDPSDAEAVLEHELTEGIMGRIGALGVDSFFGSSFAPMDLFRFTASGQRDFTGGKDGQLTYFSVDGSNVNTGLQFHNSVNSSGQFDGFDLADWDQVGDDVNATDPFGPGGPGAGDPGTLSSTDILILEALGWAPPAADAVSEQAPASLTATAGTATAISNVAVIDAGAGSDTFTTVISDSAGILTASGNGVSGSGTNSLTITGTLSAVNNALATLGYSDATAGTDTITVTTTDPNASGSPATTAISVTINWPDVVSEQAPASLTAKARTATAISNVTVIDAGAGSDTFTTVVSDSAGILTASGNGVSGSGTNSLTITGTLSAVNNALATLGYSDATAGTDTITVTTTDPNASGSPATKTISVTIRPNYVPGDFNGDGLADILWRNTNGAVGVWDSNGSGGHVNQSLGTAAKSWAVAGIGDFNGDGLADILWRNTNGGVALWDSNGSGGHVSRSLGTAATSWAVAGISDFNGDGLADILWRNTNGDVALWDSNGAGGFVHHNLGPASTSWRIAAV
jgi:hypothetical protein